MEMSPDRRAFRPIMNVSAGLGLALFLGLALGATALGYQAPQGSFSPRLGIYYQLVPYYGGYGARLTAAPVAGSPLLQNQLQLEPGDMITHLDGTPLAGSGELERHRGQTSVQFVNVRTNAAEVRWAYLPAMDAPPVRPNPPGLIETSATSGYSPRLGIFYDLVRYGGAFGARLKANPVAGSPLLQEQLQLEPGDMITHLDGAAITDRAALENHYGQTSMQFVNVRTRAAEVRWVFMPAMNAPGISPVLSGRMLPKITDVPPGVPKLIAPADLSQ